MNTSTKLIRTFRAEMKLLSPIDRLRVRFFIFRLQIRRLPQWWLKKSLKRR
jgi:hypothetical protein